MPEPINEQAVKNDPETDAILDDEGIDQLIEDSPIVDTNVVPAEDTDESPVDGDSDNKDTSAESTSDGTPTNDAPKIKVGDVEYTQEELQTALKLRDNHANWEKSLRNKSHIAANLTDEQIAQLVPYARKQKEIPRDADPSVSLTQEIAKELFPSDTLTVKDAEGLDQEIPIDQIIPLIENTVKAVSGRYQPVVQNLEQVANQANQDIVVRQLEDFMSKTPEYKILPPDGVSLKEHIDNIIEAGDVHPDYKTIQRFQSLLSVMDQQGFKTLGETYNFMYGKSQADITKANAKANQAERLQNAILKNQDGTLQEEPTGVSKKELDSDDAFIESLGDDGQSVLAEIGAL